MELTVNKDQKENKVYRVKPDPRDFLVKRDLKERKVTPVK
jgi:hypothetical protein